jgi:hypothetical protein
MSEQTLNVELLERVKAHIRAYPETFDMGAFARHMTCGTVACIAGWASFLNNPMNKRSPWSMNIEGVALKVLGLDGLYDTQDDEDGQVCPLFYNHQWPYDIQIRYDTAREMGVRSLMADIAGEAIDRFVAGNGSFTPPSGLTDEAGKAQEEG